MSDRSRFSSTVTYDRFVTGATGFPAFVRDLIERNGVTSVCEVGGGPQPMFADTADQPFRSAVLDISRVELDKAPPGMQHIHADIAAADFSPPDRFDMVVTKMVAEHITDPEQFHRNTRAMLNDDGLAVHLFPTLITLPFVVNRFMPHGWTVRVQRRHGTRNTEVHGVFPAYYRWCRGPIPRQLARLEAVGFETVEYRGLFGHLYYRPIAPLRRLESAKTELLLKYPVPSLTSYAIVVLRRR